MGPLTESFDQLKDAAWNEKLAAIILLAAILAVGLAPNWLINLVSPGAEIIMQKMQ